MPPHKLRFLLRYRKPSCWLALSSLGSSLLTQPCSALHFEFKIENRRSPPLICSSSVAALGPCRLLARPGSAWLRESIPLTGVKRTAMLRRGNALTHQRHWLCTAPMVLVPVSA